MPGSSKKSNVARRRKKRPKVKLGTWAHGSSWEHGTPSPEELETLLAFDELLSAETIDVDKLRREAALRGVPTKQLRRRVWPLLLNVDLRNIDDSKYHESAAEEHRDSSVVEADVVRSLWSFTPGWRDERRERLRGCLKRVLNGAISSQEGTFYYQGLHDIASVLLLTLGERLAYASLLQLTTAHLRDFTRPTIEPVKEILGLLHPLLAKHDRRLHDFIERVEDRQNLEMGLFEPRASRAERMAARSPPYFAIAWVITWFSHSVSLPAACRLFDLFFATHPLMPLYVATVAMSHGRDRVMACEEDDFPGVHTALKELEIFELTTPDDLARDALRLFDKFPPSAVRRAASQRGVVCNQSVSSWVPDKARSVDEVASAGQAGAKQRLEAEKQERFHPLSSLLPLISPTQRWFGLLFVSGVLIYSGLYPFRHFPVSPSNPR